MGTQVKLVRSGRSEQGAAAVEFALISIIMITLIAAIIQFSIWFWSFQAASNAAREGARRYAVAPCSGAANDVTIANSIGPADNGGLIITESFAPNPAQVGGDVTVTVTFNTFDVTGGIMPLPDSVTKTATSRVEDTEGC